MPGILGCEHLAVENVTQVAAAVIAHNLDTVTIGIDLSLDGILDFVIERWPTTTAMELVRGLVERCIATFADISAVREIIRVATRESVFGTLVEDDPTLFCTQLIVFRFVLHFRRFRAVGSNRGSGYLSRFFVDLGCFR